MVAIMAILISKPASSREDRLLSPCYYPEELQNYIFFIIPRLGLIRSLMLLRKKFQAGDGDIYTSICHTPDSGLDIGC